MGKHIGLSLIVIGVIFFFAWLWGAPSPQPQEEESTPPVETENTKEDTSPSAGVDAGTMLRVLIDGELQEMDMETYLRGVVRAEMPATFALEALKAQAVAARTYTLYRMENGGAQKHPEADACDDVNCCKAYLSAEEAAANWGEQAQTYEAKICQAVAETDGECILYGGRPILAAFHSSSAGLTRRAGEVWQSDLPYLQAVESPEAGDSIPNYYSRVEFTAEEFREKVLSAQPEADLSGDMSGWLRNAVTDSAGSVETVEVGGVTVKGSTLRSILGLRSACFEWEVEDGRLVFFVTGYGHGVGMSQYGANQMAEEGADYREILTHYYTGVTVEPYTSAALG